MMPVILQTRAYSMLRGLRIANVLLVFLNYRDQVESIQLLPPGRTYGTQQYMHTLDKNEKISDLRDKTLRVVVPAIEPPYVNYVNFSDEAEKDKGFGPGIVIEIMKDIQKSLNLTYKIVETNVHVWGSEENGTWTGAFGQLYYGVGSIGDFLEPSTRSAYLQNADVLAGGAIMQYDRGVITDLTYPFQYELSGMMIKSPEKYEDDVMLIVTEPFRWEVWLIIGFSIIFSGVVLVFLTMVIQSVYDEIGYTTFEAIWVFFSIFVQQGLREQPRTWSCRLLIALWWLSSITLLATFTGSLVALFAVDKTALPFQNIEGLVKSVRQGKYTILMDSNSLTRSEMIEKSRLPVFRELWYEMNVNKRVKYVDGIDNAVDFIRNNQGYVFIGPWDTLSYYAYKDCHLILLDQGILPVYLSIPLSINSTYSTYFSTRIRDLVERGFTEKWSNDYRSYIASQKSYKCNSTSLGSRSYLDLRRAQGAFWVLLGGLGLAALLLMLECLLRSLQKTLYRRNGKSELKKHDSDLSSPVENETSDTAGTSDGTASEHNQHQETANYANGVPHKRITSWGKTMKSTEDFREIEI